MAVTIIAEQLPYMWMAVDQRRPSRASKYYCIHNHHHVNCLIKVVTISAYNYYYHNNCLQFVLVLDDGVANWKTKRLLKDKF